MIAENFVDEDQYRFTIKDNIISGEKCVKGSSNQGLSRSLLDSLTQYPDFVGQINTKTGEKTTFAEFKDRSIRCALWLKKQGISENDVICTSMPLENDDYVPILATFFIGSIINPWYHQLSPTMAKSFFTSVEPKVMFASEQSIDNLATAAKDAKVNCKFVVVGNHPGYQSLANLMEQQSQKEVDNFSPVESKDTKVGGMFFSSGTTGNPKCAMLSCKTLLNNRINYAFISEGMNMLWYSSFSWITGILFFASCVKFRMTRILHSEFSIEETSSIIEKYKINWAFLTPTMVAQLYYGNVYKTYVFPDLKVVVVSGSKPNKLVLKKTKEALPHCFIANCFGMTESGGVTLIQRKTCKKVDSIGYVVGGVDLKVVDQKTGSKLGPNQEGEICVKLEYLMVGYWKNDEETKNVIDKEGWLHTGDLGYYTEDGEVVIIDRIKQVIITENHHVSPSQIEEILVQHPAVVDAAVVSVPHEIYIEVPHAFIVKKPGENVTAEELIELPTAYNEFFRLTGGVTFIDKIPCTSTGKKNIRGLREMARAKQNIDR